MRLEAIAALGALLLQTGGVPLEYTFVDVKSTVELQRAGSAHRAVVGEVGLPGDGVRTGWRGRSVVEARGRAARFEILPSTRAVLAGPEPGVLIVLERGRIKAFFDALSGVDERLVATPGALLAVRGTRFGVEVERDGAAAVAVFEGTVEVLPRTAGLAPLAVRAGEVCRYSPGQAPQAEPMPRGVREETWRGGMAAPGPGAREGWSGSAPGRSPSRPESQPRGAGRGQRGGS